MATDFPSSPHHPQSFTCPNCGAGLQPPGDAPTVTCPYCAAVVSVPAAFRRAQPAPQVTRIEINANLPEINPLPAARKAGVIFLGLLSLAVIAAGLIVAFAVSRFSRSATNVAQNVRDYLPTPDLSALQNLPTNPPPTATPLAGLVFEFGEQGSGPGQFDDPRSLALAPDGSLFVADYNTGRVQKFDAQGKFQFLIQVEPGMNGYATILDLETDFDDRLYVVRLGDILVYSAADGELLDTLAGEFPDTMYNALAINPGGEMVALHQSAGEDDLIRLSPEGEQLERWTQIVSGVNREDPANSLALALDGLGNTYIVSQMGGQVYVYNREGQFQDRMGSPDGDGPGSLSSPTSVAVDGQGNIYVLDISKIEIFDAQGRYQSTLPLGPGQGAAFDLAIDGQGDLYVVTNLNKVRKFTPDATAEKGSQ